MNNRLMYSETFDTSGMGDELLSTTWYYYNEAGNVTRVVTQEDGSSTFTAMRFGYASNQNAVAFVLGETYGPLSSRGITVANDTAGWRRTRLRGRCHLVSIFAVAIETAPPSSRGVLRWAPVAGRQLAECSVA